MMLVAFPPTKRKTTKLTASPSSQKTKVNALLQQATNLANNLSYAFDTPSGVPSNNLLFADRSTDGSTTNGLATAGTLVMEWTRLSDLTGNKTYAALTQKAESYLLSPQPASSEPWPGLVGTNIDINTGEFKDASGGWNGGDDSFYEYLIKMYIYDPARFATYKDRWILAADSTIAHLASHPSSRPDLTYLAAYNNRTLNLGSGHLACFDGGNFILGGLVLEEQKYVDFGLELVASCENTYDQTLIGIGPESFRWDEGGVPADQKEFYDRAGFYITNGAYDLRPEVLESFYYAYRATGDRKYQDVSRFSFPFSSHFSSATSKTDEAKKRTVVLRRLPSHCQQHPRRQRLQRDHKRQRAQRWQFRRFPGILLLRRGAQVRLLDPHGSGCRVPGCGQGWEEHVGVQYRGASVHGEWLRLSPFSNFDVVGVWFLTGWMWIGSLKC
jgi:hypothetical protein